MLTPWVHVLRSLRSERLQMHKGGRGHASRDTDGVKTYHLLWGMRGGLRQNRHWKEPVVDRCGFLGNSMASRSDRCKCKQSVLSSAHFKQLTQIAVEATCWLRFFWSCLWSRMMPFPVRLWQPRWPGLSVSLSLSPDYVNTLHYLPFHGDGSTFLSAFFLACF